MIFYIILLLLSNIIKHIIFIIINYIIILSNILNCIINITFIITKYIITHAYNDDREKFPILEQLFLHKKPFFFNHIQHMLRNKRK